FTATAIVITNTSSATWSSGQTWGIDISRGTTPTAPDPNWSWSVDVQDLNFVSGATAYQGADARATPFDIDGNLRGASPSMGAF
ncbi:MAG: hypothetical protein HKP51_10485, partial [Sulfitobacter sp.]|nr:hypothetical protein [Sulfitobacter sp.]